MELTVLVHHEYGNKEVNFQVSLNGRRVVVKKASGCGCSHCTCNKATGNKAKDVRIWQDNH